MKNQTTPLAPREVVVGFEEVVGRGGGRAVVARVFFREISVYASGQLYAVLYASGQQDNIPLMYS